MVTVCVFFVMANLAWTATLVFVARGYRQETREWAELAEELMVALKTANATNRALMRRLGFDETLGLTESDKQKQKD